MAFSFSFSGDDIDIQDADQPTTPVPAATTSSSAFPVPGKPQLPPIHHPLPDLLAQLPSKISYDLLDVPLDDGATVVRLPRRELWDVRLQLMAEDDEGSSAGGGGGGGGSDAAGEGAGSGSSAAVDGLGNLDVKTGVYEGGFKSWESSVDLVKTLAAEDVVTQSAKQESPLRVIELGCGTALPSLALFQWIASQKQDRSIPHTALVVADYNPSVLQLVTLPNFILAWALLHREYQVLQEAMAEEGELYLNPEILDAFQCFLREKHIDLSFVSGGWSQEFVQLLYSLPSLSASQTSSPPATLLIGAETIYSPFALQAFTETMFAIFHREREAHGAASAAYVGAKKLYFGVGGSLDDFVEQARSRHSIVTELRQEAEGVRRGVVRCVLREL